MSAYTVTTRKLATWLILGVSLSTVGCTFYARGQKEYRDATAKLISSKDKELDACYDNVLKTTPGAKGTVTVKFAVTEKTGQLTDVHADPAKTTAPQPLIDCVTTALTGLVLDPPDQRKGDATFEFEFGPKKAK